MRHGGHSEAPQTQSEEADYGLFSFSAFLDFFAITVGSSAVLYAIVVLLSRRRPKPTIPFTERAEIRRELPHIVNDKLLILRVWFVCARFLGYRIRKGTDGGDGK